MVSIPVVGGGMIRNPHMAETIIASGQADFVFLGRSLIADPMWPVKARDGREEDIRPCISCNNCFASNSRGMSVSCTVNPWLGNEGRQDYLVLNKDIKPRVHIAGGGPAGMQAALALDRYGFKVSLYEKDKQLGGLLNLASLPPHKQQLERLRNYFIKQLEKSQVNINLEHPYKNEDMEK